MTIFSERLGMSGRMISGSKSGYRDRHPNHLAIFNANVCTLEGKQWFGDLDLTKDRETLASLAQEIGEEVFVLFEMDARFENESSPKLDNAVVIFKPDGSWKIGKRSPYSVIDVETLTINNK